MKLQPINALFLVGNKIFTQKGLFLSMVIYKNTSSGQEKSGDTASLQDKHCYKN